MIFKMVLHDERGLSILKCSILWWITPMLTFIYNKNPSVYQSGASKSDCCAPPLFKEMLAFVQMSFVWTTKFYLPAQLMLAPLHCTMRPNYLWSRKLPLFLHILLQIKIKEKLYFEIVWRYVYKYKLLMNKEVGPIVYCTADWLPLFSICQVVSRHPPITFQQSL